MLIQRNYFKRQFSQVSCKESLFNVLAKLSQKDPSDLHSEIAREQALDPPTHPSTLTQPLTPQWDTKLSPGLTHPGKFCWIHTCYGQIYMYIFEGESANGESQLFNI